MFNLCTNNKMADIPAPARKGFFERNKWLMFAFSTLLMAFVSLWLVFVHVDQEGLLYPHYNAEKYVPNHWMHRAVSYNTYNNRKFNYTKLHKQLPMRTNSASVYKLVCYYNFPSEDYPFRRLRVNRLDPNLCTHINVAFGSIVNNSIYLSDEQLNTSLGIIELKRNNSNLKVLLSIGGAGNNNGFPEMVANHENRKLFIKSLLNLVKTYKFDGVDLDWEFPGENTTGGKQRMHFTQLLHEIRNEINRQEKHKFLLTLAVAAPVFIIDNAYDISYINDYVDFVNVMTYDYHFFTKLTPYTGINAPLYSPDSDIGLFATLNINYTSHYWLYKGLDRSKLIVGLPTYGHSFRLVNSLNHGINSPANDYGSLGMFGFVGYNELCVFLDKNQISPIFDTTTKCPYATRNHEWISFDDEQSFTFKAEYVKSNSFGGAMIYALNTDDHNGMCKSNSNKKRYFPLTRRVKEIFDGRRYYV